MSIKKKILFTGIIAAILVAGTFLIYNAFTHRTVDQNTRIVVVFKSLNEGMGFWEVVRSGIDEAAKEFGVKAEIVGPEYERDIIKQIDIVDQVISRKPEAIILAANDYNALVPSAQKIKKAGIKLITIDSGINSDLPQSFIATDNVQAGMKAGRELAKLVGASSPVVIVSHVKETATAIEREKGVREGLMENNVNNIEDTIYCENNKDIAYRLVKELFSSDTEIKGIACLNETTTLGTARAIKELGLGGKIKLVGFDNSIDEIKLLEQGVIQATVVQNPFNMGYTGIEMAIKAIKGEAVSKRIDTGSLLVTRSNMYNRENEKLLFPFVDQQ